MKDGADYNSWNTEMLANDIESVLTQGNLDYLLIDYPFAYKNDKNTPYIDYAIYIDTPLDIAMARRLLRDETSQSSDLLRSDLKSYLSGGRTAYLEMVKTIKPNSDFIVDGSQNIDEIVSQILLKLFKINNCTGK